MGAEMQPLSYQKVSGNQPNSELIVLSPISSLLCPHLLCGYQYDGYKQRLHREQNWLYPK